MPPEPHAPASSHRRRSSPSVSVVIPISDAAGLPLILRALPPVYEVIVVADPGVERIVAAVRSGRPDALVVHPARPGPGAALACGIAAGRGEVVVTLDGDGSTDPAEIPSFVAALVGGADVAIGSRYRPGGRDLTGGRFRRWATVLLVRLLNALFGTQRTDAGFGYAAFWRDTVSRLDLPDVSVGAAPSWGDGPEIGPLLALRPGVRGLTVAEVPSVAYPRMRRGSRADRAGLRHWARAVLAEYALRTRHPARHSVAAPPLPPGSTFTGPAGRTPPGDVGHAPLGPSGLTPLVQAGPTSPGPDGPTASGPTGPAAFGRARQARSDRSGHTTSGQAGHGRGGLADEAARGRAANGRQYPGTAPIADGWGSADRRPIPEVTWTPLRPTAKTPRPPQSSTSSRAGRTAPWSGENGRNPFWPLGQPTGGPDRKPRAPRHREGTTDALAARTTADVPRPEVGARRRRLESFRQPRPDLRVINGEGTGTGRGSGRLRSVPRRNK